MWIFSKYKFKINYFLEFLILKDSVGSECLCGESIIARTIKAIKAKFPQMFIVTDLCFVNIQTMDIVVF